MAFIISNRSSRRMISPPSRPALRHINMGAENAENPEFQVGDGCVIDQLVGDTYAQLAGLPPVLTPTTSSPPSGASTNSTMSLTSGTGPTTCALTL